jgi:hypothetical protein
MTKGGMRGRPKGRIGIVEIGADQEDAFVDGHLDERNLTKGRPDDSRHAIIASTAIKLDPSPCHLQFPNAQKLWCHAQYR